MLFGLIPPPAFACNCKYTQGVALRLSTAEPTVHGTPPALGIKVVSVKTIPIPVTGLGRPKGRRVRRGRNVTINTIYFARQKQMSSHTEGFDFTTLDAPTHCYSLRRHCSDGFHVWVCVCVFFAKHPRALQSCLETKLFTILQVVLLSIERKVRRDGRAITTVRNQ